MAAEPWRAWYFTGRWKALRLKVLEAAGFRCRCERCGGRFVRPRATIADHITPHRGDPARFWDESNLRAMAKRCHDRKTAGEVNARR